MAKTRVGLIRVVSNLDHEQAQIHGRILEQAFPTLAVLTQTIDGFPGGLYNRTLEQQAVPEILRVGRALAARVDVVAVSCAADPGVDELREALSIPVVGAGSCLGLVGRALGTKVGILTITPYVPQAIVRAFHGCEVPWRQVEGVYRTTDLPGAMDAMVQAAAGLVDQGCRAIGLACTGFSTVGAAAALRQALPVVVLDPVVAMGAAITCVLSGRG
ncbi:MAG: aspartate/glutamate racemase family protein [Candidatus Acetothermia bacterium]|nr:aspartate/glutamate racemase family protein [Candidatus Acetothermia bacterium]